MNRAVRTLIRCLGLLLATVGVWVGAVPAVAIEMPTTAVATYTHDNAPAAAAHADTPYDRGPPFVVGDLYLHLADDRGLVGTSACLGSAVTTGIYTYDGRPRHAPADTSAGHVTGVAEERTSRLPDLVSSLQLTGVAADTGIDAAAATARTLDDVLSGLSPGKNPDVWTVPDEAALNQTFGELTEGATPTTWWNYTGQTFERSDGVQIGLRPSSLSGRATIDIRLPDGTTQKVHIS